MNPFEQIWEDIEEHPLATPAPVPTCSPTQAYPPSLPHDLACCVTPEEVEALRLRFDYDETAFEMICARMDFKKEYSEWRQRLITEGNSFKLKLRAMAEEWLPNLYTLLNADTVAPSVKIDAFKYMSKVAGLEPTKVESDGAGGSTGPRITINIAPYAATPDQPVISIN
jgi:hypothetical protein